MNLLLNPPKFTSVGVGIESYDCFGDDVCQFRKKQVA